MGTARQVPASPADSIFAFRPKFILLCFRAAPSALTGPAAASPPEPHLTGRPARLHTLELAIPHQSHALPFCPLTLTLSHNTSPAGSGRGGTNKTKRKKKKKEEKKI